ncbi:MAG: CDGSH iron-sulfur domain-containing protein [Thermoproteus sp. AZ2]|jgi:CDGSH-type Zn-finger protein|uniref:CDGSH iron-sulfur domain-containing protein n=1 Tax=Thermoproteus sp. AZ2 TaxID=1609232 RepID=A0ACC6UZC4_9CREN|nr:MAG: zinc finger domain-containing protein [Thermoproteus sp. AZ2]
MVSVVIHSLPNGPNEVLVDGKPVAHLCRCGGSSKKPYCDGTHRRIGFKADEAFVEVVK